MVLRIHSKIIFVVVAFLFYCLPSYASEAPRSKLLAVYIYRLANNIQWANQTEIKNYHIHLVDSNRDIYNSLRGIAKIKKLHEKKFKITRSSKAEAPDGAHLVFVSKDHAGKYQSIYDQVQGRNTLLISEGMDNKRTIMINIFETGEKAVRFEINKANIINQNLGVNPDIILLGGTEIDVAKLYKEVQTSLKVQEQRVSELDYKRQSLETTISKIRTETASLEKTLVKKQEQMDEH